MNALNDLGGTVGEAGGDEFREVAVVLWPAGIKSEVIQLDAFRLPATYDFLTVEHFSIGQRAAATPLVVDSIRGVDRDVFLGGTGTARLEVAVELFEFLSRFRGGYDRCCALEGFPGVQDSAWAVPEFDAIVLRLINSGRVFDGEEGVITEKTGSP